MSQSRFSIVLVGVSALLRRPLVSRLRPADGERSSWVVFAARGCRFDSELPPSASEIALGGLAFGLTASAFGTHRFGVAAGRVGSSAFRFGNCLRRVGLRAHCFRFSACTVSELPLGELVLPLSVSEIAARRVGLRAHRFRFSACADPHRRTAEARTDGAQRHDTCFTSKHLSQHVNLPHRTP